MAHNRQQQVSTRPSIIERLSVSAIAGYSVGLLAERATKAVDAISEAHYYTGAVAGAIGFIATFAIYKRNG